MKAKHSILVPFSFLLVPFLFLGCDYADRRVTENERADGLYREAMSEYAAGRLDQSVAVFERVVKESPGNASARFQLACLLQDHKKDPLGAIRNYHEYMALFPKGDKVAIARDRMAVCERMLAADLVKKYNLGGTVAQDETITRLKKDTVRLTEELTTTQAELEKVKGNLAAAQRENERIRRMVMAGASDDTAAEGGKRGEVQSEKVAMPSEKDLIEDEGAEVDRVKFSADVANLIAEEKEETSQKSPFGQTVKKPEPPTIVKPEPPHEERPEYYVVQEGDTLFKLAIRFYGRKSAWTQIREANKATVSSDGRIRAGQKLRLP